MSFLYLMKNLRVGQALYDLDEKIAAAIKAARESNKTATITLKLTVAATGKQLEWTDEVGLALPKPPPPKEHTVLFTDADGQLTRRNPDQKEIQFRDDSELDAPKQEPKRLAATGTDSAKPKEVGNESSFGLRAIPAAPAQKKP